MKTAILIALGPRHRATRTFLLVAVSATTLLLYSLYSSSFSFSHSLDVIRSTFSPPARIRASCPPTAWAAGAWTPKAEYTLPSRVDGPWPDDVIVTRPDDMRMHSPADALAFAGFEGCASNREFYWHLASDREDIWDRWPGVTSWQWTPGEGCDSVRPFSGPAIVKDLVENGGWLLIGDSVTENHFFSLSCVLYPHVRATPDYSAGGGFDRAWPQNLYLNASSPLIPHLKLPKDFDIATTPLVTFRRVDLLLEQAELEELYAERTKGVPEGERRALFSEEQFWSLSPTFYVRELFLEKAPVAHYSTLVISTGGHWTTTLMAGFADASARGGGIDGVLDFFGAAMTRWAEQVQEMLDDYARTAGRAERGTKQVVVRAYLPGHEDCHDEREPWTEWKPFVWNWYNWGSIGEFNQLFEDVLEKDSNAYPDIHFLPIDRPALLRPDAHSSGDCLHIMTGAGVLEGWTHYIWHYVTRELPGRIR
ncbi:uncharacterized protein FIBRA_06030 [Fibroporia radiculosa]|uniref:Uncharacterized protein n=1 Tax=Fibroporia radiculosa TaxID=599839 RepID=J4H3V0_9APHY|nr:uncharacterized protein FIBRA_06030 [Fibroporia radiculosa]CCM03879.1 predicted protein [Fibroporia radiculosa]